MAEENDDILDPAEIEALLNSAGGGGSGVPPASPPPAGSPTGQTRPAAPPATTPLSAGDIDALLRQHSRSPTAGNPEALLEQAAAHLAAAVDPHPGFVGANVDRTAAPQSFEFTPFDQVPGTAVPAELGNLKDVELDLRIELGRTELLIEEVLKLREGSVVALDKLAGDPVDILVNGRLVARGEVLVLNDNFCVRVAEILAPALL